MISIATLPQEQLRQMHAAAQEVLECFRVLDKVDANIVGEVLKGQGTFYEWDHYPEGDVYDQETHAQYYYHAHRAETGEHGHFHTFIRDEGIPEEIQQVENTSSTEWPTGDDVTCHLIAIAMDKAGFPTHLFTTNRWVTGENWYRAEDVIALLDRFVIDHAYPSWPTNRWISAMLVLFRPQIEMLLRQRDEAIENWSREFPDVDVLEDRELEITSMLPINVEQQIREIERALQQTDAA